MYTHSDWMDSGRQGRCSLVDRSYKMQNSLLRACTVLQLDTCSSRDLWHWEWKEMHILHCMMDRLSPSSERDSYCTHITIHRNHPLQERCKFLAARPRMTDLPDSVHIHFSRDTNSAFYRLGSAPQERCILLLHYLSYLHSYLSCYFRHFRLSVQDSL